MDIIDNMPQGPDDPDAWRDEIEGNHDDDCWGDEDTDRCETCGGDGWGIVGTDWDCDDGINGPYDGEVAKCPDCHGTGRMA